MSGKAKEKLNLLEKLKSPGDVVYEVFRTEKRSFWFHIWDIVLDVIPSTTTKLLYDKVVYLVASEKSGKFFEIENGNITNIVEVPNWKKEDKDNFKKVVIDKYIYKKFKKLN